MGLLAAVLSLAAPHRLAVDAAGLLSLIAADEVETVSFVDKQTAAANPGLKPAVQNDRQAIPLFGMDTEPVVSGDVLEKWARVKTAIN